MIADEVADAIAQNGETVTLRRTAAQGIHFDVDVAAMVRGYRPQELVDGVAQGDRRVVISNREITQRQWPGPPRKGDIVIRGGKPSTVQGCETIRVGDSVIRHNLQLSG